MNKQDLLIQLFRDGDRTAALPLAGLLEEMEDEVYLAVGLRFCAKHNVWPKMLGGSNTIHGGSWRIVGPVNDKDAQAVICMLGRMYPENFDQEKTIVSMLGMVLSALRYR